MRIGILTFHWAANHGALLQGYASARYLAEQYPDSDVRIINYVPAAHKDSFLNLFRPHRPYAMLTRWKSYGKGCRLNAFRRTLPLTTLFSTSSALKQHADDFDLVFCGSDQIWNYDITDGFQAPYFGADKSEASETKVISYAASCGDIAEFPKEKKEELFSLVKNLDKIGVREDSLNEELKRNKIPCTTTLDPTFLLSAEEYLSSFDIKVKSTSKYLLEYALRPSPELDELSESIVSDKGIELIKICGYCKLKNENGLFNVGPEEFLSLIANADYVTTNSFHGTAFSLIFRKSFNVVLPSERRGRIFDLLNKLGLQGRISADYESADTTEIVYDKFESVLNREIEKSKQFINF